MIKTPEELIIVPGHAALRADVEVLPEHFLDDAYWALQVFQVGELPYYFEHVEEGLRLLKEHPNSVMALSGGRTRQEAGDWSEAASYLEIAKRSSEWDSRLEDRTLLEEYARDSFENIDFSLRLFRQRFGHIPEHIYVVGWGFKEARIRLHFAAIGIREARYSFVGVNNPPDLASAEQGEAKTRADFKLYPTGDGGELANKRQRRNPYGLSIPYDLHQRLSL
jgi:hypothetical protein